MGERLFLIDGTAYAYRSYYAIKGLSNSKGEPTNAAFGFARILLRLIRECGPSHIAVVFDAPGKTFRAELYPEYKANREKTPDELIAQLPYIDRIVDAFNIPRLRIQGVEADDVMGTLARRAEARGMDVVLVTGDKDMLQLVSGRVTAFDPNKGDKGVWYDAAQVEERFGVPPDRVIEALGLMGDSSDNVPGVKGIGEKTARALLQQYGTIDGVYEHLDEIKGKQRERLETDRDVAYLSRRLVTIDTDVDLDFDLESCRRADFDRQKLIAVLSDLEFQSLLGELLPEAGTDESNDYKVVLSEADLEAAVAEMRAAGFFAVDTETTSTDPMRASLVGVSMSCRAGSAYYIPVGHVGGEGLFGDGGAGIPASVQIPRDRALGLLRPLLEDPAVRKAGHNIKYDLVVLERAGIRLKGISLDTMVASYLTDPSLIRHNLGEVCLHYLKRKMIPIADLIGKGSKSVTFDNVPIDRACTYACEDADITWRLAGIFHGLLAERGLERLFEDVELPLIGVLARMEQAGIAIDREIFHRLRGEVAGKLKELEAEIYELAGGPFQINSPKQLQEVLFGVLGLQPVRKTKTGYSTDVEVLEQLAGEHPLPAKVLDYRTLEKLRGTYIEALPKLVNPETGRIHTSFNQAVAATGRLSSSEPNLQNIPVRTEIGRTIRMGFVPGSAGRKLISADYSQIELRILAHLSGDEGLMEAFANDADIHAETAARLFGVMPELVTPDLRRQAKAVNFGVIYGMSPFGLAKNLNISRVEAARFIDQYYGQYPGVRRWIDATLERARADGYVTTLLNRRRYVADLASRDLSTRHAAERVAVNTPVQGSAADVIKVAMIQLDKALQETGARLLLQVHDELVVETPAEEAEAVAEIMRRTMEGAVPLDVALKVDVGIGGNWAEIH